MPVDRSGEVEMLLVHLTLTLHANANANEDSTLNVQKKASRLLDEDARSLELLENDYYQFRGSFFLSPFLHYNHDHDHDLEHGLKV